MERQVKVRVHKGRQPHVHRTAAPHQTSTTHNMAHRQRSTSWACNARASPGWQHTTNSRLIAVLCVRMVRYRTGGRRACIVEEKEYSRCGRQLKSTRYVPAAMIDYPARTLHAKYPGQCVFVDRALLFTTRERAAAHCMNYECRAI